MLISEFHSEIFGQYSQIQKKYDTIFIMNKVVKKKRGDTLVKTIERKYNVDLGYRSDARLDTVLKKSGVPSLSKLLKMTKKNSTK